MICFKGQMIYPSISLFIDPVFDNKDREEEQM